MATRQVNARQLVQDIRTGLSDSALMQKHGVTASELQGLFKRLVAAAAITQEELDHRLKIFAGTVVISDDILEEAARQYDRSVGQRFKNKQMKPAPVAPRKASHPPLPAKGKPAVNGREVLKLVREGTSDEEIMERYQLSARGLESLFRKMIAAGLLSQREVAERPAFMQKSTVVVDFLAVEVTALKWKFVAKDVVGSPVVAEGLVYVGSWDGNVYALDATSGEEQWRFKTQGPVSGRPAVSGDLICFGSGDHHIYCLDAKTGVEQWRFKTGGQVFSSPAIFDGIVYVGSGDHHVYAVSLETGSEEWKFLTKGAVHSSPFVIGGVVFLGSDDAALYAFQRSHGGFSVSARTE